MTQDEKIMLEIGLAIVYPAAFYLILKWAYKCFIAARDAFRELQRLKDKIK